MTRIASALAALAAAALAGLAAPAPAQTLTKSIRWVVPYPAGGGTDLAARAVGKELGAIVGQSVVVENKPGAATAIGAQDVARSAPDGSSVLSGDNATFVFNPLLYSKLSYKVEELAPVGLMARFPLILVAASQAPYKSLADLVAAARKDKEAVKFASPGAGSPHHLAMEMLMARAGFSAVHVPYRGAAPAVQDVTSGHVPTMVVDTAVGLPHIQAGRLRPLAVFSAKRLAMLPDVPTMSEVGQAGVEVYAWQGMAVAAATPPAVVAALSAALNKALADAQVRGVLEKAGLEILGGTPAEMSAYIRAQSDVWKKIVAERDLKIE